MSKMCGTSLALGLGLLMAVTFGGAATADTVQKDAKGRVLSRTIVNPDASRHVTSYRYATDSDRAVDIVDEDFDKSGRTTRRVEQHFDGEGRVRETLDVRFDEAGTRTGTRTRYTYDPSGKRSEQVTPVN